MTIQPSPSTKAAAMPNDMRISQDAQVKMKTAEEEPDDHEHRPEQDVEQELVAGKAAPVQAVALEGQY